jgi:hypothetical protein
MYTMQRTQIYLSEAELAILEREAARTGRTRSRLIRDAIEATYPDEVGQETFERTLRASAGTLKVPFTGLEYVRAIRSGGFGALAERWPEIYGPDADPDR